MAGSTDLADRTGRCCLRGGGNLPGFDGDGLFEGSLEPGEYQLVTRAGSIGSINFSFSIIPARFRVLLGFAGVRNAGADRERLLASRDGRQSSSVPFVSFLVAQPAARASRRPRQRAQRRSRRARARGPDAGRGPDARGGGHARDAPLGLQDRARAEEAHASDDVREHASDRAKARRNSTCEAISTPSAQSPRPRRR